MDTSPVARPTANEPAQQSVLFDSATGLAREELFVEHLRMASARAQRRSAGGGVMFVDLGGLTIINSELGLGIADLVLGELGSRVRSAIRRTDSAARIGNDMAILCNDVVTTSLMEEIATRVLIRLTGAPVRVAGRTLWPSVRVGLALVNGVDEPAVMLTEARTAASRGASAGRLSW